MKRNILLVTALLGVFSLCANAQYPLQGELIEGTGAPASQFDDLGFSVATNGNTVAVTGYLSTIGSVLVYVEPTGGWGNMSAPTAVLTTTDGSALNFVAINGTTIVATSSSGSAYVFVMPAGGWVSATQNVVLTPSDAAVLTNVAVSGSTVVAGSPTAIGANNVPTGAAYVFVEPAGGWTGGPLNETGKLTAKDGLTDDRMAVSVATDGNTVVAGAPDKRIGAICPAQGCHFFQGAAYVFVQPANGWANMTQTAELTVSNGQPGDNFGSAVAVVGPVAVVGASQEDTYTGPGEAYIYIAPKSGWVNKTQSARLYASDGKKYAYFGSSISMSNTTVVVGASNGNVGANVEQGAAYVYTQPTGGWKGSVEQVAKLTASDGVVGDQLGWAVSVNVTGSTTVIAAGAPYHGVGSNVAQGTVYIY
jgi:FG-GAP repeat